MEEDQVKRSSWRPRFSLATVFLLMTIVGLLITVILLWREVRPIRDELVQLRNETGRLSVDDPTKMYAIEVRTDDQLLWKWRVWVPQGLTVLIHNYWGNPPASGTPSPQGSILLKPGENWITMRAHPSAADGTWGLQLETEGGSVGTSIQPADRWWEWPTSSSTSDGVSYSSTPARDSGPIFVLKRMRVTSSSRSNPSAKAAAKTTGFMIWLERR